MKVKWRTKKNKFPEMERNAAELKGKKVQVGVLGGGEAAWLASIHEYGCTIPVTDKMRGWFRAQGHPLKATTTVIRIPERPFMRNGYDSKKEEAVSDCEQAIGDVLSGDMDVNTFLEMVGLQLASGIKDYARDLSSPANSGFTVERKGTSNPLVDTGNMIESINFRVE